MVEIIKDYYIEHRTVFQEKFSNTIQNFNMEDIHKMRTSTKRLRALFQLLEFMSSGKFKSRKQLKKARKLFKFSGAIREIQIEKTVLVNYENKLDTDYPEYKEYLKQREHREISRFLKSLPDFEERADVLKDKRILKTIDSVSSENSKSRSQLFLDNKISNLSELNSFPVSNERIHKNRTILKQLYYLHDILTKCTGKNKILNVTKERLREIEQVVGEWHDLLNSGKYLNAFFNTGKGEKTEKYETLFISVKTDRSKLRKGIINILKKEMKFKQSVS